MNALNEMPTPEAPERVHTFVAPYSTVHVAAIDLDDQIGMRAAQLATLLRVIPADDCSAQMLSLAGRLAYELKEQLKRGQSDAVLACQLAELLLRAQGDDGPCDLLWLAQQIADEVAEFIHAFDRTDVGGAP